MVQCVPVACRRTEATTTMQAQQFIRKWQAGSPACALNERAGAQAHFIDLCRVLDVPEPGDPDAYCFERGLVRTGSTGMRTDGFADVWLRGHFAWEYKAPGKSLEGALKQLMMYALPLENPPLLVVSDRQRLEVHTHFTGTPSDKHVFALEDLERLTKPCHRQATELRLPMHEKKQRSQRGAVEEAQAAVARGQAVSQRRAPAAGR